MITIVRHPEAARLAKDYQSMAVESQVINAAALVRPGVHWFKQNAMLMGNNVNALQEVFGSPDFHYAGSAHTTKNWVVLFGDETIVISTAKVRGTTYEYISEDVHCFGVPPWWDDFAEQLCRRIKSTKEGSRKWAKLESELAEHIGRENER